MDTHKFMSVYPTEKKPELEIKVWIYILSLSAFKSFLAYGVWKQNKNMYIYTNVCMQNDMYIHIVCF